MEDWSQKTWQSLPTWWRTRLDEHVQQSFQVLACLYEGAEGWNVSLNTITCFSGNWVSPHSVSSLELQVRLTLLTKRSLRDTDGWFLTDSLGLVLAQAQMKQLIFPLCYLLWRFHSSLWLRASFNQSRFISDFHFRRLCSSQICETRRCFLPSKQTSFNFDSAFIFSLSVADIKFNRRLVGWSFLLRVELSSGSAQPPCGGG